MAKFALSVGSSLPPGATIASTAATRAPGKQFACGWAPGLSDETPCSPPPGTVALSAVVRLAACYDRTYYANADAAADPGLASADGDSAGHAKPDGNKDPGADLDADRVGDDLAVSRTYAVEYVSAAVAARGMVAMRRASRVDANQAEIVLALRQVGAFVYDCSRLGGGFPDLFVVFRGQLRLLECKAFSGQLTKAEREFMARCPAPVHVVYSVDEALKAIGAV